MARAPGTGQLGDRVAEAGDGRCRFTQQGTRLPRCWTTSRVSVGVKPPLPARPNSEAGAGDGALPHCRTGCDARRRARKRPPDCSAGQVNAVGGEPGSGARTEGEVILQLGRGRQLASATLSSPNAWPSTLAGRGSGLMPCRVEAVTGQWRWSRSFPRGNLVVRFLARNDAQT